MFHVKRRAGRSLPDAEPAEDLAQHVLRVYGPGDPSQCLGCAPQVLGA